MKNTREEKGSEISFTADISLRVLSNESCRYRYLQFICISRSEVSTPDHQNLNF